MDYMPSQDKVNPLDLVDRIIEKAPQDDVQLRNYLSSLRSTLKKDSKAQEEQERLLAEYEEAYTKLTSPANRIGVFLSWLENGLALVCLGDTEYAVQVDPNLDTKTLDVGVRVKLNEGYAVVGTLDASASGSPGACRRSS